MMDRLEARFDAIEAVSHRDTPTSELTAHVCKHLAEAHALEAQSIQLMEKAATITKDEDLSQIYAEHLDESRRQIALIEKRIESLGGDTSTIEDASLRLGGLNWGLFFQAQSDTPAKLAAFAYAVEHLEIAGYELLKRSARRAGDLETEQLCDTILTEERAMTERVASAFDRSVEATLNATKR